MAPVSIEKLGRAKKDKGLPAACALKELKSNPLKNRPNYLFHTAPFSVLKLTIEGHRPMNACGQKQKSTRSYSLLQNGASLVISESYIQTLSIELCLN